MMYSSPNVIQNRNEHNLMSDFKSEYEMYIHNEKILNFACEEINGLIFKSVNKKSSLAFNGFS